MVTLASLTTSELQYLRSKWNSEETELNKEKARKQDRLNDRLNRQAEDTTAQGELEASLQHAQTVLADLQAAGSAQATIDAQQLIVDKLQTDVDSFGSSVGHVTNTDAMLYQMELDELEQAKSLRTTKLSEIDTLLGS